MVIRLFRRAGGAAAFWVESWDGVRARFIIGDSGDWRGVQYNAAKAIQHQRKLRLIRART